jgi:hypothetical protein
MNWIEPIKKYLTLSVFVFGLLSVSISLIYTQDLPKEIRGYKVHQAKISVKNQNKKSDVKDKSEAFVKIGEPELTDVSLTGITFELPAEIESPAQNGTIDFLTFHDFRVNGLKVDVEEYKESFEFKKNQSVVLPKPFKIFIGAGQTLRGAFKELKESKNEWTVTGRVFVFGRFKKSFLKFKRVIPVEINLNIKNPLKNSKQQTVLLPTGKQEFLSAGWNFST